VFPRTERAGVPERSPHASTHLLDWYRIGEEHEPRQLAGEDDTAALVARLNPVPEAETPRSVVHPCCLAAVGLGQATGVAVPAIEEVRASR
jgi:hypothetical protein